MLEKITSYEFFRGKLEFDKTTTVLQLSLIKNWFDLTGPDGKNEDYREITPYWCSRLLRHRGVHRTQQFWKENYLLFFTDERFKDFFENTEKRLIEAKLFISNKMTLGYPKSTDTSRIKEFEHLGIEIREGREEWGAEKGKLYFVIKHGKRIK